jgi:hypothetical protein
VGVARLSAENEGATCLAAGRGEGEVGCIRVEVEPHVPGGISDRHFWGACGYN